MFALIGTKNLTLNNSIQDPSYVRQPLGYKLFRDGGIPYARCNFAKVIVNNQNFGVYVNLEPTHELYMQRNVGNSLGNLYETEWRFDLTKGNLDKTFNQEGFSKFEDQQDLALAIAQFDKGFSAAKLVLDVEEIVRVFAMQAVVKHWDGYPNNTFIYNDMVAVEDPKIENVRLKLIPSGIDGIFSPDKPFEVKNEGIISKLILSDKATTKLLQTTLQSSASAYAQSLNANLSLVDKMLAVLKGAGVDKPDEVAKQVDVVKKDMNGVKAGIDALILKLGA